VLLTEAFIPARPVIGSFVDLRGVTIFCMYLLGIFTAVCVALLLRRTILKGETPPFVMELPSYKLPSLGVVLYRVFDRGRAFVVRAGTLIFAVTVLVWASAYFPRSGESLDPSFAARQSAIELETKAAASDEELLAALDERQSALDDEIEGAYLRHSYLGRAGQWVEPVVAPIGWDWRIGCAVIASFPAREVVVGTLGVIYDLGKDEDEDSLSLREKLQTARRDDGTKAYNIPVALSILVFFALCAQCAATIAVIKRETNSWRWPAFTFAYMTTLAYFGALATYRIGMYFS
jgi:ferrous iron transport protein B